MSFIGKTYFTFCSGMGIYGFTRGYRSNIHKDREALTAEKCINGIVNGICYAAPILNMGPTFRLLNRLEIEYKNLNKEEHKSNYEEFMGMCNDTI